MSRNLDVNRPGHRYFLATTAVWDAWKRGSISYKEREETLAWYRRKLHEMTHGKQKPPVYQKPPKKDDQWIEEIVL